MKGRGYTALLAAEVVQIIKCFPVEVNDLKRQALFLYKLCDSKDKKIKGFFIPEKTLLCIISESTFYLRHEDSFVKPHDAGNTRYFPHGTYSSMYLVDTINDTSILTS